MPSRGHGWGHGFASLPDGPAVRASAGNADHPTSTSRLLAPLRSSLRKNNLAVVRGGAPPECSVGGPCRAAWRTRVGRGRARRRAWTARAWLPGRLPLAPRLRVPRAELDLAAHLRSWRRLAPRPPIRLARAGGPQRPLGVRGRHPPPARMKNDAPRRPRGGLGSVGGVIAWRWTIFDWPFSRRYVVERGAIGSTGRPSMDSLRRWLQTVGHLGVWERGRRWQGWLRCAGVAWRRETFKLGRR